MNVCKFEFDFEVVKELGGNFGFGFFYFLKDVIRSKCLDYWELILDSVVE